MPSIVAPFLFDSSLMLLSSSASLAASLTSLTIFLGPYTSAWSSGFNVVVDIESVSEYEEDRILEEKEP